MIQTPSLRYIKVRLRGVRVHWWQLVSPSQNRWGADATGAAFGFQIPKPPPHTLNLTGLQCLIPGLIFNSHGCKYDTRTRAYCLPTDCRFTNTNAADEKSVRRTSGILIPKAPYPDPPDEINNSKRCFLLALKEPKTSLFSLRLIRIRVEEKKF